MTLILKSDKKATASLGNINGINGPQDWSMFLDFEKESYATKRGGVTTTNYALTDVVEASRANLAGAPISISKSGVESKISSTTAIRTALLKNGRFGLLAEDLNFNYFLNSATPANQTVTLPASLLKITASCEGTGSLTITGDILNGPVTVDANNPKVLDRSTTSAPCNLNIVVNGSLTHAQIEIATGSLTATSKITTTSAPVERTRELVKVKQSLFNSIIQNKSGFTVVAQTIDYNPVVNPSISAPANRLGIENATLKVLHLNSISNGAYTSILAYWNGSAKTNNDALTKGAVDSNRFKTYNDALALASGKLLAAFNGVANSQLTIANPFTATDITLGNGYYSPLGTPGLAGIVTKLVIYDRVLTQDEITTLTKSWR